MITTPEDYKELVYDLMDLNYAQWKGLKKIVDGWFEKSLRKERINERVIRPKELVEVLRELERTEKPKY